MEVTQKMQLFKTDHGKSKSDWHILMVDVLHNFQSMYEKGMTELVKFDLLYVSGFDRLDNYFRVFVRCMLRWSVEEDGSINKELVDILTDVETHMADAVRFISQHSGTGAAGFDGKDFSNIDHLLPRMYKACLHVLIADPSPPTFDISSSSFRKAYGQYIENGSWENQDSAERINTSTQLRKVRNLKQFVCGITDKINHENVKELMICLESLYDKVACLAFLRCWERYYNMYLSHTNNNVDTMFDGWVRKILALSLDTSSVTIWTDENLKIHVGYVQQLLRLIQKDGEVGLSRQVKDQLETLCRELDIIVYVQINCESQLHAEHGSNLTEIQALVRSIESLGLDTAIKILTTQTEDINHVIDGVAKKISHIQSLLTSVLEAWILQFSSSTTLPLTDECLIEFIEFFQRVSSRNFQSLLASILKHWILQFSSSTTLPLTDDLLIEFTECVQLVSSRRVQNLLSRVLKVWILQFSSCATLPLSDEFLIQFTECVQRISSRMLKNENIIPRGHVKDQFEFLQNELGILIHFHINYPSQLYADQGLNLVAIRMEVQTVAWKIASFIYSSLISENKQDATKVIFGIHNLLTTILGAWLVQLTINNVLPLTDEFLIQFTECVQRVSSRVLKDTNIIPRCPVKDQVEFLLCELGILINFHINYPSQLYAGQGLNLVDVRKEVQAVAWKIASFINSFLITETKQEASKVILGLHSVLTSILGAWLMQLTINNVLPVTDELLIQFIECVQRVSSHMLKENIIPRGPVKDQVEFLLCELEILIHFHINYPSQLYDGQGLNLVAIRTEVQTVAWKIASFIHSSLINETKIDAAKVIFGLHNLLISILRAWTVQLTMNNFLPFVDELLIQFKESIQHVMGGASMNENTELPVAERHHLHMRNLFKFKANQSPNEETTYNITIEALVQMRSIASKINTFTGNRTKYVGPDMRLSESALGNKFAHLKAQVMDAIYVTLVCKSRQVTPQAYQLNFFNFLLDNMKQLISSGFDLIGEWEDDMQAIHEALLLFRDFLESSRNDSIADLQDICKRVVNVAYEAEYLIYSFYNGVYPASCIALWVSHFAREVELTKVSVLNIFEKKENVGITIHESMGDQDHGPSQALIPIVNLVVGFEGEMQHVKQQLVAIQHLKTLDVVSIIGMPGLGKTTLARKVYEDRQIVDHFIIRAWCVVSKEYNKKDLLLTILSCMIELTDMIQKMNELDLSTRLYKQLVGRRYLIVMDDVWDIDAFEFLKVYLPDNNNGSRILLTSRNRVIGMKAKHHSDFLNLRLLTDDESWLLLSKKVYHDQKCPMELCPVGKRIAKSCRGLPLAIVVVGGLLAKSHKTIEFWEQVAENLSSLFSHDSQAQGMEVLKMSYRHMPHHLKPLFLYVGAFPEDREILIENLIWLWIAEGFVRDNKHGTLEHQAELYLMDLIDRSFLMVATRRSDGRVKTCIVHDLLREMCLLKAKEEHLLLQINVLDDFPNPISYQNRLSVLLQRRKEDAPTNVISNKVPTKPFIAFEDLSTLSLTPPLYSFLFFNKNKSLPLWKEAVASVLCDLKLLRILHFESTLIDSSMCGDIMMLVHLRYVSIRAAWTSIPESVSRLRSLETLIIKGLRGEIAVPDAIWELVRLRHLHINDRAKFRDPSDKSSMLQKLETLSTPAVCHGEDVKLMKRLPNVRKLRCVFLESCPMLESSKQIESFKAIYTGVGRCPGTFVVPSTLKKLSLFKFRLKWEEISKLHRIPQLEILNLRNGAVDGESWDMNEEDDEFLKLKVLKLENLNIRRWTACASNFPCLEKLVLKKCKQLMGIPNELAENYCLEEMEVLLCSNATAISAKCIEDEQKAAGNESLEVRIYPPATLGSSS